MARPLANLVNVLTPKRRRARFTLAVVFVVVTVFCVWLGAVGAQKPKPKPTPQTAEVVRLNEMVAILKPLHAPLGKPRPNGVQRSTSSSSLDRLSAARRLPTMNPGNVEVRLLSGTDPIPPCAGGE
jgi:hypothetical protein